MGTVAGILATLAVSHLSGSAAGGLLARFGILGFGRKLKIAGHVLRIGKALRASFKAEQSTQAKNELQRWLQTHDPNNESKLGDGVVNETKE